MSKKKNIIMVMHILIAILIVYLMIGLTIWDFNIKHWSTILRGFYIFGTVFFGSWIAIGIRNDII
jgi:hypothetical protein